MARTQLKSEGNGFFKWDKPGTSFTGEFVKLAEGAYQGRATYHGVFKKNGGEVKVNTPTVLRSILAESAQPGMTLEITYTGDKRGNQPQPIKLFDVFQVDAEGEGSAEEYQRLLGLLKEKNAEGAPAIEKALAAAYPDPGERTTQLRQVLKLQGVAV